MINVITSMFYWQHPRYVRKSTDIYVHNIFGISLMWNITRFYTECNKIKTVYLLSGNCTSNIFMQMPHRDDADKISSKNFNIIFWYMPINFKNIAALNIFKSLGHNTEIITVLQPPPLFVTQQITRYIRKRSGLKYFSNCVTW